jgi:hypothetical protein
VLIALALAASTAMAQSASNLSTGSIRPLGAPPVNKPIDLEIDAPSIDFMGDLTESLADIHHEYLKFKKELRNDYEVYYAMQVSVFPQWGTRKGGPGTIELVYAPDITWNPFTNTAIGSGSFNVAVQRNQFWTKANAASQQARLGLITQPNDWGVSGYQYNQIMYTHTLPGSWSWLSVTVGQYTFLAYDDNLYAGNAQTNFITLPLAQNATQTYPQGGLGAYAQAATPDGQFAVAGGFQGAASVTGESLTTRGFATGKYAYFAEGEWWPSFLAGGGLQRSRVHTAVGAAAADQLPGCVFQRGSEN